MQIGKRHSRNVTHLTQRSLLALIWSHEMAGDQGDRSSHGPNWHRLWPEGWPRWPQGHEKPTGEPVQDLLFRDEETQLGNDRFQGKLQTGWAQDEQKVGTTYEAALFANFGQLQALFCFKVLFCKIYFGQAPKFTLFQEVIYWMLGVLADIPGSNRP